MKKGNISPALARVHAHLCGDGSAYIYKTKEKGRKNIAVVGYYNNNQRLLETFRKDFSEIFNELTARFGKFGSREWRIHSIIKDSDRLLKREWLIAFFEDEAYHEKRYNRLKIKSMNLKGLEDVKEILRLLDIFSSLTGPNCDNSYYLTIPKFDSISFFKGFSKEPARRI